MKLFLAVFVLVLSGCATMAPYSYEEECAMQGMKLVGADHAHGRSTTVSQGGRVYIGNDYSTAVRCDVPRSETERKQVEHARSAVMPKYNYNDWLETKRTINGAGYLLFVVPGVALKLYFDSERDRAIADSEAIYRTPASATP